MRHLPLRWLPLALAVPLLAATHAGGQQAESRAGTAGAPPDAGAQIEALLRQGALAPLRVQEDPDFPGRRHLRYEQRVDGVRVFGAQLVEQVDPEGRTLTVFGHVQEGLTAAVTPTLDAGQAIAVAEGLFPAGARVVGEAELVFLPRDGRATLTWMMWVRFDHHLERVFVNAGDGSLAWSYADLRTDAAVGLGTGVWGDRKKVATESGPDGFRATDRLRPPALATWDFNHDSSAAGGALHDGVLDPAYVAHSPDNTWRDGAVVDAHAYAGWAYDYFFERHQRRGIDGRDLPVRSVTHFTPLGAGFANAFWDPFQNAMYYGDGDATYAAFSGALDVVVHELTHGVTQYTWDGIYAGESGALNEAFSDIMATGAEFFHEPAGHGRQHADYYLGEDLSRVFDPPRMAVRSMENPSAFCSERIGACDPDHYSLRYRGSRDNGGVHHNSAIANQAFYLLVEGGVNRTSGIAVAGLGPSRRGDAERIFYRGFTTYLTPSATFADARAATVRAASELFGPAEAAQVEAAWTAVGVE
jgi:Zn-dependent metalloprotease